MQNTINMQIQENPAIVSEFDRYQLGKLSAKEADESRKLFSQKQFDCIRETFVNWILYPPQIVAENYHLRHDTGKVKFVNNGSTSDDTAMAFTIKLPVPNFVLVANEKVVFFDEKTKTPVYGAEGTYFLSSTYRFVLLFEADANHGAQKKHISLYSRERKIGILHAKKSGIISQLYSENNLPEIQKQFLYGFLSQLNLGELLRAISDSKILAGFLLQSEEFRALTEQDQKDFIKSAKRELNKGYEKMLFLMNLCSVAKLNRIQSAEERYAIEGKYHQYEATQLDKRIETEGKKPLLSEYLQSIAKDNALTYQLEQKNWKEVQLQVAPTAILQQMYRDLRDEKYAETGYNPKHARQGIATGPRPTVSPLDLYVKISEDLQKKSFDQVLAIGKITEEKAKTEKKMIAEGVEKVRQSEIIAEFDKKVNDQLWIFSILQATLKLCTERRANAAGIKLSS